MSPKHGARWQPGSIAVLREVHLGRVWSARPGYVVSDEGERASFYFPWNTVCHWPWHEGQTLRVPVDKWHLEEGGWLPYQQLHVMEIGAIYHVSVFWHPRTFEHAGWKVDFHAPADRARLGFDALDWALDLMISPDRSYYLKDEDEFAQYQERDLLNAGQVASVRAEVDRVIELLHAKTGPFADRVLEWRPDPEWERVPVPLGWDQV